MFRKGDILRIVPADGDDPVAVALAGETCEYVKERKTEHHSCAEVAFGEKRKTLFLRFQDLKLVTA